MFYCVIYEECYRSDEKSKHYENIPQHIGFRRGGKAGKQYEGDESQHVLRGYCGYYYRQQVIL